MWSHGNINKVSFLFFLPIPNDPIGIRKNLNNIAFGNLKKRN